MSLAEDIAVLRRVPLLADLNDQQLQLLAFSGERTEVAEGAVVIEAGSPADGGYVLLAGALELTPAPGVPGQPHVAAPATLINAPALIVEATHGFGAVAKEPSALLYLRRAVFRRLLDEFPTIARRLHAELAARVSAFAGELARVGDRLADDADRT
jgi:CRP-like cAMP-binding protein